MCGIAQQGDAALTPGGDGIALEQFDEPQIVACCGAHNGLKRFMELRRATLRNRHGVPWLVEMRGVERHIPIDVSFAGSGYARLEATTEILRAARAAQMLHDVMGDAANGEQSARARERFVGVKLPAYR